MIWLSLAKALILLVQAVMNKLNQEQLIQLGRDQEAKKNLESIQSKLAIAKRVKDEVAGISDDDITKRLRDNGWIK